MIGGVDDSRGVAISPDTRSSGTRSSDMRSSDTRQ